MAIFKHLRRDQREAIGLLQVGTFLEYFDLMLYVHMAVVLNEIFFPKTDAHTAALLSAFAFCSTYVLRPFGALIFGYIGDHIGRKTTVIITTTTMAISCIIMANLPTYAQIGISAAWIVTICRIMQGLSSMGEIIGAIIYVMEITEPPLRYPAVSLIGCVSRVGTMVALLVATLVTSFGLNWRLAFWIGATIALVGSVARSRLRETPEFANMKKRMQKAIQDVKETDPKKAAELIQKTRASFKEKVPTKTTAAFFVTECAFAVVFYFTFMHGGNILKEVFGYTAEQVIHQNLIMSIVQMVAYFMFTFAAVKKPPLKIIRNRAWIFLPFAIVFPLVMNYYPSIWSFSLLQAFSAFFVLTGTPAVAIFMEHFPIFQRFTYMGAIYAGARAIVYVITSFGLVYLTDFFGNWSATILLLPTTIGFIWAVGHFEKLRKNIPVN